MIGRENLLSLAMFSRRKTLPILSPEDKENEVPTESETKVQPDLDSWLLDERVARIDNRHIAGAIPAD